MPYASPMDLQTVGIPPQAFGQLSQAQIAAALQNASDFADSFFRNRWGTAAVPLLAWDSTITKAVAKIAAYYLIVDGRGVNPNSLDWELVRTPYNDAVDYLNKIQRQQATPFVTLAATGQPGTPQPNLTSSSVVNLATGATRSNRGW